MFFRSYAAGMPPLDNNLIINNSEFVGLCWINSSIKRVQRHRTRQVRTRSHSPTSFFILTTAPTTVPAIF